MKLTKDMKAALKKASESVDRCGAQRKAGRRAFTAYHLGALCTTGSLFNHGRMLL